MQAPGARHDSEDAAENRTGIAGLTSAGTVLSLRRRARRCAPLIAARRAACYRQHMADRGVAALDGSTTMETGPLGSAIHVLRADAGTIAELAALDWSRSFSRVGLDPVRGLVTLMTPSRLHEDLTDIFSHLVDAAAGALFGAAKNLKHTRLRGRGDPPGTGLEPDCAFYLGDRARAYRAALAAGEAEADAFFERTPLDLVVEAEITHRDEGKVGRYAEMGVRELWRLHGRQGTRELRVDFFALRPGAAPRRLDASEALGGLTPGDVCEAVDGVRLSVTAEERLTAVTRIVRRRRQASVRVREEETPYAARPG